MTYLKMHSMNKIDENVSKIAHLFPNCVTEAKDDNGEITHKIDFDMLKQELSNTLVEGREERYQFTWPDKKQAILTANAPINKTLRPCREESVNFDNTENLYIEGDNLEVLKLLQETYLGKIKMIYIDPPYNTGNDFVYEDDFAQDAADYIANSGQTDEEGNRLVANTESNGRFHTDWLNMMYPRLKLARDLLSDDGAIFISIDDNEVRNMRNICDEIFGIENFAGTILWKKKTNGNNVGLIPSVHDYIIVYVKDINKNPDIGFENNDTSGYSNPDNDPRGLWTTMDLSANHKGPYFGITNPKTGEVFFPSEGRYWVFNEKEVNKRIAEGRIIFGKSGNARPVQRVFLSERGLPKRKVESWWDNKGMNEDATEEQKKLFGVAKVFSHPKPTELIKNLCSSILRKNDMVLDFFSGSATTAQAIFELNKLDDGNRRFILIQLPENIDENLIKAENSEKAYAETSIKFLDGISKPHFITEIGKERIRRAGQQILKQVQNDEKTLFSEEKQNLDIGFRVLKCDTTNMEDVYYTPDHIDTNDLFKNNIKSDRTGEDLLFQTMLDLGIMLSSKIETKKINGKEVFCVEGNYLMACFDDSVDEKTITEIAKEKPYYFVMRDPANSKDGDSLITNFEQIFTTYSPDTVRKVL